MDEKKEGTEVVPNTLDQAQELTDIQIMQARQIKLSGVAREIEAILVREDMTWGDWGEIVEMLSRRIGQMVSVTKIKTE